MDILFIILAITLPAFLIALLIRRGNLSNKNSNQSSQVIAKSNVVRSSNRTIWIVLISLLIGGSISAVVINYNLLSFIPNNNHTKFSVKEFISLMDNFQFSELAEKCLNKDFIEFHNDFNDVKLERKNTVYDFFYVNNFIFENLRENRKKCFLKMKERISIWNYPYGIEYALKNEKDYLDFIDSLKFYQLGLLDSDRKSEIFNNAQYYIIKNCVFKDAGYNNELKEYRIYIYTFKTYNDDKNILTSNAIAIQKQQLEAQKQAEVNRLKQDSINTVNKLFTQGGTAMISVIHTFVYKDENEEDSHIIDTLKKGDKISVKATHNNFCRCDYNLDNGKTGIGYILKSDLMPDNLK